MPVEIEYQEHKKAGAGAICGLAISGGLANPRGGAPTPNITDSLTKFRTQGIDNQ
jgi:hypothetical protein